MNVKRGLISVRITCYKCSYGNETYGYCLFALASSADDAMNDFLGGYNRQQVYMMAT